MVVSHLKMFGNFKFFSSNFTQFSNNFATKLIHTLWFFGALEIEILRENQFMEFNFERNRRT